MPRCKDCGEVYEGRKANHVGSHVEPETAPEPVPNPEIRVEPVEMEDFSFGGYTVQAPKGCAPLYSESHPVLGLTKVVFQTAMTAGDGRVEAAGQYVWRQ